VFPKADIPVVAMSINSTLDPRLHFNIGQYLSKLRHQGVLIISSGSTTHGRFHRGDTGRHQCQSFINSLSKLLTQESSIDRQNGLIQWDQTLPYARMAHGREEHFIPLMVAVGAARDGKGTQLCDYIHNSLSLASFCFN